ncbi:hypothetical protein KDL44_03540 [bacterium]|nr:hypothetical protein [bacterium]
MKALREDSAGKGGNDGEALLELHQTAAQPAEAESLPLFSGDAVDSLISLLLALDEQPAGGWHQALGITAREVRRHARDPQILRLRLRLQQQGQALASTARLQELYRHLLLQGLLNEQCSPALVNLGRLIEKLPDGSASSTPSTQPEQEQASLERLELLLQRLEQSRLLLDPGTEAPQTDTPQQAQPAADPAPAGEESP